VGCGYQDLQTSLDRCFIDPRGLRTSLLGPFLLVCWLGATAPMCNSGVSWLYGLAAQNVPVPLCEPAGASVGSFIPHICDGHFF
jgi:hypothetical protein